MKYSNLHLLGTVFITGAAVLILEVTAVRILSPVYGSSLNVLSSILTVVLTALSLGYWYGGKLSDRNHSKSVLYTIITYSGISVLVLLLITKWLLPIIGPRLSETTGPLVSSVMLFLLPAFLLGIVSPFVIKIQSLTTPTEKIGSVIGNTFFWGTFGSITGSLTTGFIFIPRLGVTNTIFLVSAALIALGTISLYLQNRQINKKLVIPLMLALLLINIIYRLDGRQTKNLYTGEGLYSRITVRDLFINKKPTRLLQRDLNSSAAMYLNSDSLVFPNLKLTMLYDTLVTDPENVLILGGGAYIIPKKLSKDDPELSIDVVEIEPSLFKIAQKYFNLDDTAKINNHIMDARVFLQKNKSKKYDFIFSDIFNTNLAPPFHITTQEFYLLLQNNLQDDGVLMINTVGKINNTKPSLTGSVIKTLQSAFPHVIAYSSNLDFTEKTNITFIASNKELPDINPFLMRSIAGSNHKIALGELDLSTELILTDDYSPIEYLANQQ